METTIDNRFKKLGWRQPIPTNLESIFGEDYRCMLLFKELVFRANNTTQLVTFNGTSFQLRRGEVVFGRKQYAKYLGWPEATVRDTLVRLRKYDIYDVSRTTNKFTVIAIKSYDSVIYGDSKPASRTTAGRQQDDTSNSDNSDNRPRPTPAGLTKEEAWTRFSSKYLKEFDMTDERAVDVIRIKFISKAHSASERAVAGFITQGRDEYAAAVAVERARAAKPSDEEIYPDVTKLRLQAEGARAQGMEVSHP